MWFYLHKHTYITGSPTVKVSTEECNDNPKPHYLDIEIGFIFSNDSDYETGHKEKKQDRLLDGEIIYFWRNNEKLKICEVL